MRNGGISVIGLMILLCSCAKAPIMPNTSLCLMAESNVRQRLGPEFRRVLKTKLLHGDRVGTYGCAIVYEMIDEELSEEFENQASEVQPESHVVAFLSRAPGASARFLDVKRTRFSTGPVSVKLEAVEVTGDEFLDLVIVERAKRANTFVDYQGLKIINGDPNLTSEILETALVESTSGGSDIIFEWMVDDSGPTPKLWLRGGDQAISYSYSEQTRRLIRDQQMQQEAVKPSDAVKPKPPAGPQPKSPTQPKRKTDEENGQETPTVDSGDIESDPSK